MKPNDRVIALMRRSTALCGALSVAFLGLQAQETANPPAGAPASPPNTAPMAPEAGEESQEDEEVVTLSPFVVDASRDIGYYAENTLAGSRMNTKVSDLGSSITVVTMQQLQDTASTDINDVFRYEANTEGSLTYTPAVASFRNDGPLDVIAGGTQGNAVASFTNATANRVRGIGVPDRAINNYPAIAAIPMDAYNIQRLEISRGPNSMLFGMGSPAGIVNQSSADAVLGRNSGTVSMRIDNNGSRRASIAVNRTLLDDRLAVYGALLYNDQQFERKPSYDRSERMYGAITFKPFSKTKIRASVEDYLNDNRRPNSITPRDFITEWRMAGMPAIDSTTGMVTITATGEVKGPYILNASHPNAQQVRDYVLGVTGYNPALRGGAPSGQAISDTNFTTYNGVTLFGASAMTNTASVLHVPGLYLPNSRPTMQIVDGEVINYFQPTYNIRPTVGWGTATNPRGTNPTFPAAVGDVWTNAAWSDVFNRGFWSAGGRPVTANIGNYRYPGVTDRDVYDWEEINVNQMNFGRDYASTYNIEFEQEIFDNLFFNAGWFRQQFESATNYTVAQLNATALFIDPNVRLPDGSANPMFGKPYVEDFDPDRYEHSMDNDSWRAMLAYEPDFTRNDGWTRWLGRHQILGLISRDESDRIDRRLRPAVVAAGSTAAAYRFMNNQNENADGSPSGWALQQGGVLNRRFYLAGIDDPFNSNVTQASGEFNHLAYSDDIRVYNYQTSAFENMNITHSFNVFDSPGRGQRVVDSISAGITSHFWDDRLVTTIGVRRDDYKARINTTGAFTDAKGVAHPALTNQEKFVNGKLNTDLVLNRWNVWDELSGTTKTVGGVFRPFRNWDSIDRRADNSLFWEFLRDLGFSYNKSDNFNPPPSAQVDIFGNSLPKPEGEGEDWGFQFSLFDNRVFARVTWFEATNLNERMSGTAALGRINNSLDENQFRAWAWTIARINMGDDPTDASSWDEPIPAGSEKDTALRAASEEIWQQPYLYYGSLPGAIGVTRDAAAKGIEAQINYNPMPNWTIKATFGKQDTVYDNVLKEIDAWVAHRMPIWQSARAADYLLPQYQSLARYQTEGGRQVDLTNFWSSYGYTSDVRDDNVFGWTTVENYYNLVVVPQVAVQRDLQGQKAPGQRRYRASLLTTYQFQGGMLEGFDIGGAQRWEDRMIIGYYGKASGADVNNLSRLDQSDVTRPIYDSANMYTDLWVGYRTKLMDDKVRLKLQLNVSNVFESGELRPISVDYEGTPNAFRIIDPRRYTLTATFDF